MLNWTWKRAICEKKHHWVASRSRAHRPSSWRNLSIHDLKVTHASDRERTNEALISQQQEQGYQNSLSLWNGVVSEHFWPTGTFRIRSLCDLFVVTKPRRCDRWSWGQTHLKEKADFIYIQIIQFSESRGNCKLPLDSRIPWTIVLKWKQKYIEFMRLRTLPFSHPSSRFQDVLDEKASTSTQRIRNQMWIYPQIVGSWLHTRNHAGRAHFGRWPPSFGSLIFWLTLRWRVFPGKSECLPVTITKMYQNINIVFFTRRMFFANHGVFASRL